MKQPGPYISRQVDRTLFDKARTWNDATDESDPTLWIVAESEPGHGNSALLERFIEQARDRQRGLKGCDVLHVSGARKGRQPSRGTTLSPLVSGLREAYPQVRRGAVGKRWHEIRNTPVGQLVKAGALAIPLVIAFLGLVALTEHMQDASDFTDPSWWKSFFRSYLPTHMMDTPVKALLTLVGGGTFFSLWLVLLQRLHIVSGPGATLDDDEDAAFLSVDTSLAPILSLLNPRRRLILIVDDAYRLPVLDHLMLTSLLTKEHRELVQRGLYPRTLLISVETADSLRATVSKVALDRGSEYVAMRVPPFTPAQIHRIAVAHGLDKEPHYDAEFALSAGENVQRLFAERKLATAHKLVLAMQAVLDDDESPTIFSLTEVMALWTAADVASVTRRVLSRWLDPTENSELFALLRSFGIGPPQESSRTLRLRLEETPLVRTDGKTLYFDVIAAESVEAALGEERQKLLTIAHLYWFKHHLRELEALADDETKGRSRLLTRTCAAHVTRLLALKGGAALERNGVLEPWLREPVVRTLTASAQGWIRDGDFKEATDRLREALAWCALASQSVPVPERDALGQALWSLYWETASSFATSGLGELANLYPAVAETEAWKESRALQRVLNGDAGRSVDKAAASSSTDLRQYTDLLIACRSPNRFVADSLVSATVVGALVPGHVPSAWSQKTIAAVLAGALQRTDWAAFDAAFALVLDGIEWAGQSPKAPDRTRRSLWCSVAWHLLALAHGPRGADSEAMRAHLQRLVALDRLPGSLAIDAFESFALRGSVRCLGEAMSLATLLGQSTVALDASMHMLWLARSARTRPDVIKLSSWSDWHELFKIAREHLDAVQWRAYEDEWHYARWMVLSDIDVPDALGDLDYLVRAVLANDCSFACRAVWVERAARLFTNYNRTSVEAARAGELQELWVREFVEGAYPLGIGRGQVHVLLEKAYALKFASRFAFQGGAAERADVLADEAMQLAMEASGAVPAEAVRKIRRELIYTRLARRADPHTVQTAALVHEMWADTLAEQEDVWALAHLLIMESEQGLLDDPWPTSGHSWRDDPENARLGLPPTWSLTPEDVPTRLSFRLAQLFLFYQAEPTTESIDARIARFADVDDAAVFMRAAALVGTAHVGATLRWLLPSLLQISLASYEYRRDLQRMIDALELLAAYDPLRWYGRLRAEKRNLAALLKVQVETRRSEDMLPAIVQIERVFNRFVQPGLESEHASAEAARRGITVAQLREEKRELTGLLSAFERRMRDGDGNVEQDLLARLPDVEAEWLTVADLWALQLMTQFASNGRGERAVEGAEHFASRLADASTKYMRQIVATIKGSDAEMEKYAVEMMELLEAQRAS